MLVHTYVDRTYITVGGAIDFQEGPSYCATYYYHTASHWVSHPSGLEYDKICGWVWCSGFGRQLRGESIGWALSWIGIRYLTADCSNWGWIYIWGWKRPFFKSKLAKSFLGVELKWALSFVHFWLLTCSLLCYWRAVHKSNCLKWALSFVHVWIVVRCRAMDVPWIKTTSEIFVIVGTDASAGKWSAAWYYLPVDTRVIPTASHKHIMNTVTSSSWACRIPHAPDVAAQAYVARNFTTKKL